MPGDFTPIVYSFPRRDLKIYAVADLHVGSAEFMERAWLDFQARLQHEPDSRLIIVGDMMNNAEEFRFKRLHGEDAAA